MSRARGIYHTSCLERKQSRLHVIIVASCYSYVDVDVSISRGCSLNLCSSSDRMDIPNEIYYTPADSEQFSDYSCRHRRGIVKDGIYSGNKNERRIEFLLL